MTHEDLSIVLEIECISFPNPWMPSTFEGEIENAPISNPYVIVYKPVNRIIGYVIYWFLNENVQISNISIHPDFRRLGVGEEVMHRIRRQIKKEGAKHVLLEVRPSNTAAQALYNKLGFQILGIRQGYYSNPTEDALVMGRNI